MFVLSRISPEYPEKVIRKIARILRPGGKLLIRDYGRYDEAQLRFGKGAKVDDNFYVRSGGTCAYYFDIAELNRIVTGDSSHAALDDRPRVFDARGSEGRGGS